MSVRCLLTGFILLSDHLMWSDYLCFPSQALPSSGNEALEGTNLAEWDSFTALWSGHCGLLSGPLFQYQSTLFPGHWGTLVADSSCLPNEASQLLYTPLATMAAWVERLTLALVHPLGFQPCLTGSSLSCFSYVTSIFSAGLQTSGSSTTKI